MHSQRKLEHLRICLEEDVSFRELTSGFECYRFIHQALPELDLSQVDTTTMFLGHPFQAPILIASMTGGTQAAQAINRHLDQVDSMMQQHSTEHTKIIEGLDALNNKIGA